MLIVILVVRDYFEAWGSLQGIVEVESLSLNIFFGLPLNMHDDTFTAYLC